MNALLEDLGLDTANPDDDQAARDSHGCVPDGKYHARLVEHAEEIVGDGYRVERMKFQLLAKPFAGKLVKFDLFKPHDGQDEGKKETAKSHCRCWYHRLGVLTSFDKGGGKKGYKLTDESKPSIRDYLGAECIIDVTSEERSFIGKKGEPVKFRENKVQMFGIYALNDPKVKEVKRGDSSTVSTPAPSAKQPEVNLDGI